MVWVDLTWTPARQWQGILPLIPPLTALRVAGGNLHNLVTVSKRHLGRRLARLDRKKMAEVCRAVAFALQCDG